MRIEVASLRKNTGESRRFEFKEDIPPFEIDGTQVTFTEPALVHLEVTNTGISLAVKGEISGQLELICSRCLEPFNYTMKTNFEEQYRHISEAEDNNDDDRNYQVYEEDYIDLTDTVRENLILSLPMKPVCSHGCMGICPDCGVNKNVMDCDCKKEEIDPRLAVLKDFFNQ
jgi:uncharacterized protein